jgi:hypothetical protein
MSHAQKLATRCDGSPLRKKTARRRETPPQTMVLTVTNGMNQKSVRSLSQSISVPLVYYFYLATTDAFDSIAFPKIIFPAVV